ncbi:hypothetical protein CDT93_18230 [Cronobacter sakazakii]|nr:hypothetical protein CDT87_15325 [Cronobacter sakazakii]PQV91060.1 hypothetical protein CDT93_18230 [Cronobacter sakazakii]PQX96567.1 hypothetical protein C5940_05225 [Cronobacter sakazakii]
MLVAFLFEILTIVLSLINHVAYYCTMNILNKCCNLTYLGLTNKKHLKYFILIFLNNCFYQTYEYNY